MKVAIYGTGCAKCHKLEELVRQVVEETGMNAEIVKVSDIKDIVTAGVMVTPAMSIDGKMVVKGHLPSLDEIRTLLAG